MEEAIMSNFAAIRNIETQLGQLSLVVNNRPQGTLPGDTTANPKDTRTHLVLAVSLRNERDLVREQQGQITRDALQPMAEHFESDDQNNLTDVVIQQVVSKNVIESEKVLEVVPEKVRPKEGKKEAERLVVQKKPPAPFPQRFARKKKDDQYRKFFEILKQLSVNIPLLEALKDIPMYAKRTKDFLSKKINFQDMATLPGPFLKLKDPGSFTIPCMIGDYSFAKALCDLGASINLMPLAIYKKLGLPSLRPTVIRLQLADRTLAHPESIIDDVLVQVDKFIFPIDFVILDCKVDIEVPLILGRPFLATGRALVDCEVGELKMNLNYEEIVFHVQKSKKRPSDIGECSILQVMDVIIQEKEEIVHPADPLEAYLLNLDKLNNEDLAEWVLALEGQGYWQREPKFELLNLSERKTPTAKS
ncbi:uncharacterized protein [Nicotiana tomentosiformis]|uniref:uncharacterized protein n=1 Tax=Nicotiana tomentosiformis TaxID=4098 RepID=UPI00051C3829|nr:uncharacterized protein LOC104121180 [Nicotiana tomentosiformis]